MTMHKIAWYRGTQLLGNKITYSARIPARWAKEIDWLLTVEGTIGSPTAASLRIIPQIAAMHTRDQLEDMRFQSTSQTPIWGPVPDTMLPDGAPGEVATRSLGDVNVDGSTALLVPFRQAGGYWTRLAIDVSTTGGDSAGFQISLEAIIRD